MEITNCDKNSYVTIKILIIQNTFHVGRCYYTNSVKMGVQEKKLGKIPPKSSVSVSLKLSIKFTKLVEHIDEIPNRQTD